MNALGRLILSALLLLPSVLRAQEPMSPETARDHLERAEGMLRWAMEHPDAPATAVPTGPAFRETPNGRSAKNALFYAQLVLRSDLTDRELRSRAHQIDYAATRGLIRERSDELAAAFQRRLTEDREMFYYPMEDAGHLRSLVVRIPDRIFYGSQIDHIQVADEVDLGSLPPTPNDPMSIGVPIVINIVDRLDSLGGSVNSRRIAPDTVAPVMRTIPVTAVLSVDYRLPHPWGLTIYDPRRTATAEFDGRRYPLRRDLSASLALSVQRLAASKLGKKGLKDPEQMLGRAGIYFADPYQPAREAVIFLHGLNSSPDIWGIMAKMVMEDPDLSRRYRVAVGYYPTGKNPEVAAATLARDLLRDQKTLGLDRVILVGHSMGGLVSRLLTSKTLREDGSISPEHALIDDLPFVKKAFFIGAPFAGAPLADFTLSEVVNDILGGFIGSLEGIDALRERGDFVKRLLRTQPQVETHVVAGYRIRPFAEPGYTFGQLFFLKRAGPAPFHFVLPNDGVVPLTSALSLRGAKSVALVPASHSDLLWRPETVERVRMVLAE